LDQHRPTTTLAGAGGHRQSQLEGGKKLRDITPTYVVQISDGLHHYTASAWRVTSRTQVRADGRPTAANLKRYVESFEASTRPDGYNAHLGETTVKRARINHNITGTLVAEYTRS
jgi:hypothetical protein